MNQSDIVMIVLDTQRADRLGCYGYRRPISPNLDAFAEKSVLFERAVSPAQWTIPSHASFFTGLYPTAHQVIQSTHSLGKDRPHLVELLRHNGYDTIGFCNNPLVGVLNNGLKRGFQTFYNYGGAIPTLPKSQSRLPYPFNRLMEAYTQFLRRISYPIQNFFSQSDLAFSLSLHARLTPLWTQLARFKGQNARSVADVCQFLTERRRRQPLFLFLNLMETHLPFTPPPRFVEKWAPDMVTSEGKETMNRWNRESYRWGAPLERPHSPLEARLLSDMYDAEVAYQDDYLQPLLSLLNRRENTATFVVSDHGDGLGEHGFMGHAFVAYQELTHVPLIWHWEGRLPASARVSAPVSSRRLFHSILDIAGAQQMPAAISPEEIHGLSLKQSIFGADPENQTAYSEVYPPLNFIRAVSDRFPQLIERHNCHAVRRAVTQKEWKLIVEDSQPAELFDLSSDPQELLNQLEKSPARAQRLNNALTQTSQKLEAIRDGFSQGETLDLSGDEQLLQRLRGLGYID